MREMGVIGIPASKSFAGRLRIDVSFGGDYQNINWKTAVDWSVSAPANQGWMTATRMLSAATRGSRARMRPSTPCFEALYCGALAMPCHDAAPDQSVSVSGMVKARSSSTCL